MLREHSIVYRFAILFSLNRASSSGGRIRWPTCFVGIRFALWGIGSQLLSAEVAVLC